MALGLGLVLDDVRGSNSLEILHAPYAANLASLIQ